MKGTILITAEENQIGVSCSIADVSTTDRFHLIHSLSKVLKMTDTDMKIYMLMRDMGIFGEEETTLMVVDRETIERAFRNIKEDTE